MSENATYTFAPGDKVLPGARFVNGQMPNNGRRFSFDRQRANPDFDPAKHMVENPDYDVSKPVRGQPPRMVPAKGAPPQFLELEPLSAVMSHADACKLEEAGYTLNPLPRPAFERWRKEEIAKSGASAEPADAAGADRASRKPSDAGQGDQPDPE